MLVFLIGLLWEEMCELGHLKELASPIIINILN
jgi:hypothetical protein